MYLSFFLFFWASIWDLGLGTGPRHRVILNASNEKKKKKSCFLGGDERVFWLRRMLKTVERLGMPPY